MQYALVVGESLVDVVVSAVALEVAVVDTIGAGDTFSAALIDAVWDDLGADPEEVLSRAARAASVTVSRPGADPPRRSELGLIGLTGGPGD